MKLLSTFEISYEMHYAGPRVRQVSYDGKTISIIHEL